MFKLKLQFQIVHKMITFSSLIDTNFLWPILSTVLVFFVTMKAAQWILSDTNVPIRDSSKRHNWRTARLLAKPCYCSICEALIVSGLGVYCDCCGVCADQSCVKKADRRLLCKIVNSDSENMQHHWVKGNLPLNAVCDICEEDCCLEPGLTDYQCCWCQRTVHSMCKSLVSEECDLGPWRRLIIPPWCIRISARRNSMRRYHHVQSILHPGWDDWMPLIVIANRKSGNNDGDHVLSAFRRFLNPAQILDLDEKPPVVALQWAPLLSKALRQGAVVAQLSKQSSQDQSFDNETDNIVDGSNTGKNESSLTCRFLAAGGDGTIAWILNTVHKMALKPAPSLAILPLGTGNDLSRVLGWGSKNPSEINPNVILHQIINSKPVALDRWNVDIKPCRHLGLRMPSRSVFMYNYLSIGVDAQVTLNFHQTRESPFYLFSSRLFNKLLYLLFGTHQTIAASCQNLQDRIDLYLDGLKVNLPSIESIVILNIPSWGAGVQLWSMGSNEGTPEQSISDGKLEVLAIYSSFHIAQLQVGLSQPIRIGQAKVVEVKLKNSCPVQIDGEPWKQHPANIIVTFKDQANVLQRV